MCGEISWQVELTVKHGELDNFRALTREMVESTKREPGVLIYERFVSEDDKVVYVYERYADSAAAAAHLLAFTSIRENVRRSVHEYGRSKAVHSIRDRDRCVAGILDRFGATYLGPLDGFSAVNISRCDDCE